MPDDFPAWLRIAHFLNFLLITLLIRSGLHILMEHPRLYFNENCTPGSEWLKFTKKKVPTDRIYTAHDDVISLPAWLGLPGGGHRYLGMARHWHFLCAIFWVVNGAIYFALLFLTGEWRRLVPTSWSIFPKAFETFLIYLSFRVPPAGDFHPYDALQQLSYAAVVFLIGPLMICTGAAQSPALNSRYPRFVRLFGGRQGARSIHFITMCSLVLFIVIHVVMVVVTGFAKNMNNIVLGLGDWGRLGIVYGLAGIFAVILINVFLTKFSFKAPRAVQHLTGALTERIMGFFFDRLTSRQQYDSTEISPYFWLNGRQPTTGEWPTLRDGGFNAYRLEVRGLVERPLTLSLDEIKAMAKRQQITKHHCIQGWTGIAEWGGLPLNDLLTACGPLPEARYVVFYSYGEGSEGGEYYDVLDLHHARHPQTLLAYEMNGEPLPDVHGAPLRLRVETKLGFKMVKWISSIELVAEIQSIGQGQGGYQEDRLYFGSKAEI